MKSPSLRTKFILAFMAVSLAAIALVAVFAIFFSNQQFNQLIKDQKMEELSIAIQTYLQENGSLAGIERFLRPPPMEMTPGQEPPMPRGFVLANPEGLVILGHEEHPRGTIMPKEALQSAVSVEVEGEIVAYLEDFNPALQPGPQEASFIRRTNNALLYASLGAVFLSVILGLVFTQTLLKPLEKLETAIVKMKQGDTPQVRNAHGQDELGQVIQTFNAMSQSIAKGRKIRKQMTADIAHELRSPLTVISGYLEAMEEGTLPPSAERIAIIKAEVDQLNRLVTDLRTLALADAGQLSIEKAPVKPSALFLRLKSAFELLAKQKQIDLVFETAPNLSPLLVDEGRMVQALSNLLSNALRHTPEGGRITLSAIQDADAIQLIVEDTGEGIPPESLDRMFERFYRVDDSRFASKGETGLGLSIVKAIIEAHSGKVTVHSQIGTGTTFTLILPRAITS